MVWDVPSSTDRTLTRRIGTTLAAIVLVDLLVAGLLAALLVPWLAPLGTVAAALGVSLPPAIRWLAVLVPGVAVLAAAQLWYARRRLLASVDATPATEEHHSDLLARVRRLATLADLCPPAVAVVDSDTPNSFTVGGLTGSTLVVTTGLLAELDGDLLDAVLAHELAHVANRDAAVLTLATFLPALVEDRTALVRPRTATGVATWLGCLVVGYPLAAAVVDAPLFSAAYAARYVALVFACLLLGGIVVGILAVPATVLAGRLARDREFAADRAGALLTGDPASLALALERLDGHDRPSTDARRSEALAHLCLLPQEFGSDTENEGFTLDVRTHPSTGRRIERLRSLTAELEG